MRSVVAFAVVVLVLTVVNFAALAGEGTSSSMPLPLKVAGTQVLNSKGEPGILRGVNCASMEWTSDDDWLLHVMQALQDHKWSWTAWDFHPQAGPTLISDWNYTPTPDFGVFVRQMFAGTLPRYTPPTAPATPPQP